MGAGVDVVDRMHVGKSQGVGRTSGDVAGFPECVVNTLITPHRSEYTDYTPS